MFCTITVVNLLLNKKPKWTSIKHEGRESFENHILQKRRKKNNDLHMQKNQNFLKTIWKEKFWNYR